MFVTAPTAHPPMSALKALAPCNMDCVARRARTAARSAAPRLAPHAIGSARRRPLARGPRAAATTNHARRKDPHAHAHPAPTRPRRTFQHHRAARRLEMTRRAPPPACLLSARPQAHAHAAKGARRRGGAPPCS